MFPAFSVTFSSRAQYCAVHHVSAKNYAMILYIVHDGFRPCRVKSYINKGSDSPGDYTILKYYTRTYQRHPISYSYIQMYMLEIILLFRTSAIIRPNVYTLFLSMQLTLPRKRISITQIIQTSIRAS